MNVPSLVELYDRKQLGLNSMNQNEHGCNDYQDRSYSFFVPTFLFVVLLVNCLFFRMPIPLLINPVEKLSFLIQCQNSLENKFYLWNSFYYNNKIPDPRKLLGSLRRSVFEHSFCRWVNLY